MITKVKISIGSRLSGLNAPADESMCRGRQRHSGLPGDEARCLLRRSRRRVLAQRSHEHQADTGGEASPRSSNCAVQFDSPNRQGPRAPSRVSRARAASSPLADQPALIQDFAEIWQAAHKIVYSKTRERGGDSLSLSEGSLYPALHRLEAGGLVKARWQAAGHKGV